MSVLLSVQGWLEVGRNAQMALMEKSLWWVLCPVRKGLQLKPNMSSEPQFGRLVPQVLQRSRIGSMPWERGGLSSSWFSGEEGFGPGEGTILLYVVH